MATLSRRPLSPALFTLVPISHVLWPRLHHDSATCEGNRCGRWKQRDLPSTECAISANKYFVSRRKFPDVVFQPVNEPYRSPAQVISDVLSPEGDPEKDPTFAAVLGTAWLTAHSGHRGTAREECPMRSGHSFARVSGQRDTRASSGCS